MLGSFICFLFAHCSNWIGWGWGNDQFDQRYFEEVESIRVLTGSQLAHIIGRVPDVSPLQLRPLHGPGDNQRGDGVGEQTISTEADKVPIVLPRGTINAEGGQFVSGSVGDDPESPEGGENKGTMYLKGDMPVDGQEGSNM